MTSGEIGETFSFLRLPLIYLPIIGLILLANISKAEMVKTMFYRG